MKHVVTCPVHELNGNRKGGRHVPITEALAVGQSEATEPISSRPVQSATPPDAIRGQLERILNSKAFARSPRISRFLSFVVEQTLAGQENKVIDRLRSVFGRERQLDSAFTGLHRGCVALLGIDRHRRWNFPLHS